MAAGMTTVLLRMTLALLRMTTTEGIAAEGMTMAERMGRLR